MIIINEDTELVDFEKELKNNGYKHGKSIFSSVRKYKNIYYIGKSWENVKLENSVVLGSISIDHVVWLSSDSIEWVIYFRISRTNGDVLRGYDVLDLLLDQFNKSSKVLYDSIKKSKVIIGKNSSSLSRKHGEHLNFEIRSRELPISKGIEDLKKLFKTLPLIVRRIDSIMIRKQRGRF